MNTFWSGLVNRVLKTSTNTFGETVTFFLQGGGVEELEEIEAIFDSTYQSVDPDTEHLISANQPTLGVNLNDIDFDIKQDDKVQVRGITYRIIDKQEDGQGGALLILHRESKI